MAVSSISGVAMPAPSSSPSGPWCEVRYLAVQLLATMATVVAAQAPQARQNTVCRSGTRAVRLSQARAPSTNGSGTIARPTPTSSPTVPVCRWTRCRISTPQPARVSTAVAVTEETATEWPRRRGAAAPDGGGGDAAPTQGARRWARRLRGPGMVRVSPVRGTVSGASAAAWTVARDPPPAGLPMRHRVGHRTRPSGGLRTNRPAGERPTGHRAVARSNGRRRLSGGGTAGRGRRAPWPARPVRTW